LQEIILQLFIFQLVITRAKCILTANVPLLKPAIVLIKKYERKESDLSRLTIFPLVTNKDLNMNLKVISEICETGIPLNFYIARHTFVTTITLSQGVPITSIKEMMGMKKFKVPCSMQKQIILLLERI
jgi:hypothetical protein